MQKINIDQVKELDNSIATLFDIKTISEPTAQKGWSCISYPTQNKLAKADVPTAYDFLKDKLDNADGSMQTQIINNGLAPNFELNGYYYYANGLNIYKSKNADLSNPTLVTTVDASQAYGGGSGKGQFLLKINLDNKHIFIFGAIGLNDNEKSYICTFNDNWEQLYLKNYDGHYTNYVQIFEEIPVYNNKGYIHLFGLDSFILISIDENGVITDIIEKGGSDEFPDGMTNVANFYTDRLGDIFTRSVVYDNKLYWCTSCMVFYYDFLTNEYHNFNPALPTGCIPWGYNYRELGGTMFIYNGFLTIVNTGDDQGNQLDKLFMYQLINGSWILVNTINGNTNDFRIKSYFFDGTYHYFGLNNTNLGLRYFKTIDFTNINVQTITNQYNDSVYAIIIANNDYIFITENNGYCLLSLVLTPYTDTINGIDIKYYKNGDWKICTPDIAVGNDDNLQSVFEFLGYLNYWWIDTTEEKITLQRNSNMWTMMYVGDDYEDSSLPSGSFEGIATKDELKELIPDQTGNNGKFLTTNGTTTSWAEVQGGGSGGTTTWFSSCSIDNSTSTTATNVAVNSKLFTNQISTDGTYTFSYDGSNWELNSNNVDLEDYGISFDGTATSGDTIVVVVNSIAGNTLDTGLDTINTVLINGLEQVPLVDYRVSSGVITFTTALLISDYVGVK